MMASGPETKMANRRGNYPLPPAPVGPLRFGLAHPYGHSSGGWLQTFYQLGHSIWQPWT